MSENVNSNISKHKGNEASTGLEHSSLRSHRPASRSPHTALTVRLRVREATFAQEKGDTKRYLLFPVCKYLF